MAYQPFKQTTAAPNTGGGYQSFFNLPVAKAPAANVLAVMHGAVPSANDSEAIKAALPNLAKYHPDDQVRILNRASKLGLTDKQAGAKAVTQILQGQNKSTVHYTPYEQAVKAGVGGVKSVAGSIGQIATDASRSNPETRLYAGQSNPTGESLKYIATHQKQLAGDALTTATLAGGPEGKALLSGGKLALTDALKLATAGGAGTQGFQMQNNSTASIANQAKNDVIGAAAGVGIPLAGAALGSVARGAVPGVFADSAAHTADAVAVAPKVGSVDQALVKAGQNASKAVKGAISKVPGGTKALSAATAAKDKAITSLVESQHPLFKAVAAGEQSGKVAAGSKNLLDRLRGDTAGAARIAKNYIDTNKNFNALHEGIRNLKTSDGRAVKTAEAIKDHGNYTQAIREMQLMDKGSKVENPERYAEFKQQAAELRDKYGSSIEDLRKLHVAAEADLTKKLVGHDLSEASLEHYKATDPEYIRTQRIINEERKNNPAGKGQGGAGPLSTKKVNAHATQEAVNPLYTLHDRAYQVHAFIANNDYKRQAIELASKSGVETKALRTSSDVLKRNEIRQSLKDSRPVRNKLQQLVKTHGNIYRRIQTDLNRLNKQALGESLKKTAEPSLAGKLVDPGVKMTPREVANVVHSLVQEDPTKLVKLRKMIANRDPKAVAALDDLTNYRDMLATVGEERRSQYMQAQGLSDKQAHGMPTVSFYKDGVLERHQVPLDIATAINHYNTVQMNGLFNSVKFVNNVFKYGTTQGNPAFAIPNFLKDQASSFLNSESALRTHNPLNIFQALTTSIRGNSKDPRWAEFQAHIGSTNLVDVNKNLKKAANDVSRTVDSGRSIAGKVQNVPIKLGSAGRGLKLPFHTSDELINKLENATRFQNYKGTYNLYKARGATDEQASSAALLAARRNSTDFSAGGDLGKFLNSFTPYLNAGIQGVRTIGRSIKERPATTTAKIVIAASPAIALANWNLSDPQRAKVYASVPDYVKQNNFVIVHGNTAFLIPMSQELQGISNVFRHVGEARFGFDPKSAMSQSAEFVQAMSPIALNSGLSAVGSVLPAPLKTSIEIGTNKDFYTGNQVIPDYVKAQNPVKSEQHYAKGTSGSVQKVANVIHQSPLAIDYFNKNAFGELGGPVATNALDAATGQSKGGRSLATSVARRFVYQGGNAVTSSFNNIYYPLKDATDTRRKYIYSLAQSNPSQAERKAQEYNANIDQAFKNYHATYGKLVDTSAKDKYGSSMNDKINALKISISHTKAGKPYVKY